jgi:hypothetical protein
LSSEPFDEKTLWKKAKKTVRAFERETANKRQKIFIFELKDTRKATGSEMKRNLGQFERLDQMKIPEERPVKVWIKDFEFSALVFREVFRSKDGTEGERYLATNTPGLKGDQFRTFYKKRWGLEEYHKSLKQNASIGSSPAHQERAQ